MSNDLTTWKPTDAQGLTGVDPQAIMERVAAGELLRDIAASYGVSRSAVSHYIAKHANKEQWQQVREESMAARIEQAIADVEGSSDQFTLARAREAARLWTWRATCELGHIYQQKPSTAVAVQGEGITVQVVSYATAPTAQLEDDDAGGP